MSQPKVGTRRAVPPRTRTPQGGWGDQAHQRGVGNDPPRYTTALVLDNGTQLVAIIEVDSIGFDPEWTERILDAISSLTGLTLAGIRFSCTHPLWIQQIPPRGDHRSRDMIVGYVEALPLQIAGAVWQAQQDLRPVRVGVATGSCKINMNCRPVLADDE